MRIHPEFDGEVWHYEEFEASTIRELLMLLPKGTRVRDYYPKGYAAPIVVGTPRKDRSLPPLPPSIRHMPSHPEPNKASSMSRGQWTYENTKLAILWNSQKVSGAEIGQRLGFSRHAVFQKIQRERKKEKQIKTVLVFEGETLELK